MEAIEELKNKVDEKTLSDAVIRSYQVFSDIQDDPTTYLGRASTWCSKHDPNSRDCLLLSLMCYEKCWPPLYDGINARYRDSEAYNTCRRACYPADH
jgi:hypothetical protein